MSFLAKNRKERIEDAKTVPLDTPDEITDLTISTAFFLAATHGKGSGTRNAEEEAYEWMCRIERLLGLDKLGIAK